MSGAYEIAAVALRSQQQALDTLANNVANMNTPTYRRSEVQFSEIVADGPATSTAEPGLNGGVRFTRRETLQTMGELRSTGNRLDLAVDGSGFIELMGPQGQTYLWRGGALTVNEDGYLAAANGYSLLSAISIPDDATDLTIYSDGRVAALDPEGQEIELGQIDLVHSEYDGAVERLDDGLYRVLDGYRLTGAMPGDDGAGRLMQGFVEGSNVDLTQEMVQLLMVQRAYAASAQVVQTADQLAAINNNLKR